jgi:hypothetical protein
LFMAVSSLLLDWAFGSLDTKALVDLGGQFGYQLGTMGTTARSISSVATYTPTLGDVTYAAVGTIGGWVFYAAAIAGLRNRGITPWWVIERGLMVLLVDVAWGALAVGVVVILDLASGGVPGLLLLTLLVTLPTAVYIYVRIVFYPLAIFDGCGPIESLKKSWRISEGSVWRLFGWGIVATVVNAVVIIAAATALNPGADKGMEPIRMAVSVGITGTGACFAACLLAMLYESQLARHHPSRLLANAGPATAAAFLRSIAVEPDLPAAPAASSNAEPTPPQGARIGSWKLPGQDPDRTLEVVIDPRWPLTAAVLIDGGVVTWIPLPKPGAGPSSASLAADGGNLLFYLNPPAPGVGPRCLVYLNGVVLDPGA